MNKQETHIIKCLGILFAFVFMAFSCIDLHQLSHDDQMPSNDCAVCILSLAQHQSAHIMPTADNAWQPKVFLTQVKERILFRNCEKTPSQRVVYNFNKAPPVI